jgi:hypothetical protein
MLFGIEPISVMNPETQKKEKDYWKPSLGLMMRPTFLQDLIGFDKEGLTEAQIKMI